MEILEALYAVEDERKRGSFFTDWFMERLESSDRNSIESFLEQAIPGRLGPYVCLLVSTFSRMPEEPFRNRQAFLDNSIPFVKDCFGERWCKYAKAFS